MQEFFIIPFIVLGFYGIDGFSTKLDKLFYFKTLILTMLFLIITDNYENYGKLDECLLNDTRTEYDLSADVKRSKYDTDKTYNTLVKNECIQQKQCYDKNSEIKCYYRDDPTGNSMMDGKDASPGKRSTISAVDTSDTLPNDDVGEISDTTSTISSVVSDKQIIISWTLYISVMVIGAIIIYIFSKKYQYNTLIKLNNENRLPFKIQQAKSDYDTFQQNRPQQEQQEQLNEQQVTQQEDLLAQQEDQQNELKAQQEELARKQEEMLAQQAVQQEELAAQQAEELAAQQAEELAAQQAEELAAQQAEELAAQQAEVDIARQQIEQYKEQLETEMQEVTQATEARQTAVQQEAQKAAEAKKADQLRQDSIKEQQQNPSPELQTTVQQLTDDFNQQTEEATAAQEQLNAAEKQLEQEQQEVGDMKEQLEQDQQKLDEMQQKVEKIQSSNTPVINNNNDISIGGDKTISKELYDSIILESGKSKQEIDAKLNILRNNPELLEPKKNTITDINETINNLSEADILELANMNNMSVDDVKASFARMKS